MSVKITIDYDKCIGPLECGKCMRVCLPSVFVAYPLNRQKGKVCKEWKLEATFKDKCTFCRKCEEICPKGAIKLEI